MSEQSEQNELVIPNFDIRYTEPEDAPFLKQWLSDPEVYKWFPMADAVEIEDATSRWISFCRYRCSLTATVDGTPCGLSTLYLQPYKKLAHQCEFGIIVGQGFRGKGVGSSLMKNIIHLAKTNFHIELLHLQVYSENPAMHLYQRFGFKEFGRQKDWIKEINGDYTGRVFMERYI